ncbi:MAG: VCBS repeat-containing protein [Candidatus Delongbacteria bacterium]|nr:VCBS repeat-containing protein [Candidatus Delongbacteria bacterium]MCG2760775.1 C25 family cysteine peptidase [Candidatus Delongbacteria bacterium]
MIFTYKERVYKEYSYSGYVLPVIFNEVRFSGQYADSIKINSISTVLIKPDLDIPYFEGTMPFGPILPRRVLAVGARGVKRHGGFSVLEECPFFIRLDSLFFVTSIDFSYYLNKSEIKNSKSQIYEKLDLVIITSENFAENFEVYKNFKTKQGYKTIIKNVEEIYSEYPGVSNVIKIRNYIKDRYIQNDLEFVIIGGGYSIVPVGETLPYVSTYTGTTLSDALYSNLDGDPDNNKNGIYFEESDNPDYYGDVYVGRFPGNSEQDIDAIINKTIKYYSADRNYRSGFNTSLFLAGFEMEFEGDGRTICNYLKPEYPATFSVDSMYEGVTPDFNYDNMIAKYNAGYNFIYSQSHGDTHLIRQTDNVFKIWSDQIYSTQAISGLYFIGSCESGSIFKDSFSRKAMTSPDGGCVNYIGSSGEEFPWTAYKMNAYFINRIFNNKSYGESLKDAAILFGYMKYATYGKYLSVAYSLQGDPSNKPFLREPKTIDISSIEQFKGGNGTVSGTFSTLPNDTIFITVTANNEIVARTKTSGTNFTVSYNNLTADSVKVNYHSQEVFLKTYSYQTYAADEIAFQISDILLIDENYSGIAEDGENFGITFKFSLNSNISGIDSLVAKITGVDHSEISVINSTKRFRLPNVGTYLNIGAFNLNFSSTDSVVSDSVAVIDFEIQKKDGTKLFAEKVYVPVAVPYLKLQSLNRIGNILKPKFINSSKGTINSANIELLETTKSLDRIDLRTFYSKTIVNLSNISGYKIVSDSVSFSIDSTRAYKFAIKIDDDKISYSDEFFFNDTVSQPITIYADHSIGKINLEWNHSYTDKITYNVYTSETYDFSVKKQENFELLKLNQFSFYFDDYSPFYAKVTLVDSTGTEFISSDPVKIEPIPLYKNTTYKIAPFQLFNPMFVDGKLISNSQNSSIAGLNANGTPVNGSGLIHTADLNGFSGEMQQGYAIGDVDGDGQNDMVNYSFNNTQDSVLVKVVNLTNGTIIAQRKIYGRVMETAPVLVNADEDSCLEILISVYGVNITIGGVLAKSCVYMLNLNGNSLEIVSGFPLGSNINYYVHSPSYLDLNNDGTKELIYDNGTKIIIHNASTLTKIVEETLLKNIQTSISYCDLDNDGNLEMFVLTDSYGTYGKFYCYNFNGTTLVEKTGMIGGMNLDMKASSLYDLTPPVSFADIDDDGSTEIIVLTALKLYVFKSDFTNYPNFPVSLDSRVTKNNSSAPSIADLDGDGYLDILFYDENNRIWAYSGSSGAKLSGFPILLEDMDRSELTGMSIADLDSDGDLEFAAGVRDGVMVIYDYPIKTSGRPIFDKYRGDTYNSGLYQPLIPSYPINVSIVNSASDVTISWDPVTNVNSYILYSSSSPYGTFIYLGETSSTSFVIYNITEARKFYYIKAVR